MTKQQININYKKNQDFNELHKAFMETLYFCFSRYFSAQRREIIMLASFFDHAVRIERDSFVNYLISVGPS